MIKPKRENPRLTLQPANQRTLGRGGNSDKRQRTEYPALYPLGETTCSRCGQMVRRTAGICSYRINGDDSFRSVYSDILGKYNNREGIVIDTRFNCGGRLHEDIEILFSGKKYFTQVVRGRKACDMPSRRWNKPSIMVACEAHAIPMHTAHRGCTATGISANWWVCPFREP